MSGALGVPTQVSMLQANQEESNLQRCPRITKKARRSGEVRMIHSKYAKGKLERAKGGEIVGVTPQNRGISTLTQTRDGNSGHIARRHKNIKHSSRREF